MQGISIVIGQKGSGKSTILEIVNSMGFYTTELSNHVKFLEFEGKKRTDLEGDGWTDSAISLACENGLRQVSGQVFLTGIARPIEIDYLIENPHQKRIKEIKVSLSSESKLISHLKDKGVDTYSVDISHKKIKKLGFEVAKVIQPQLHPLFLDENFSCFYSKRLNENLDGRRINNFPHPFI